MPRGTYLRSNAPSGTNYHCLHDERTVAIKHADKLISNMTCVHLKYAINFLQENLTEIVEPLQGSGFCSQRPDGTTFGVFPTLEKENAPQPLAYFPLTGGNIDSLTLPSYQGTILGSSSPAWMNDSMFGSVAVCNATNQNAIQLSNVPYGVWGPLAINL